LLQAKRRQDRLAPGVGGHLLGLRCNPISSRASDCREAPKDLHGSEAVPPKKLNPGNDGRGASDHCVERLERLLLAEPRDPFDQELQVGLNGTEIDVLRVTSWDGWVVIVWHVGSRQSRGCEASASRSDAVSLAKHGDVIPQMGDGRLLLRTLASRISGRTIPEVRLRRVPK